MRVHIERGDGQLQRVCEMLNHSQLLQSYSPGYPTPLQWRAVYRLGLRVQSSLGFRVQFSLARSLSTGLKTVSSPLKSTDTGTCTCTGTCTGTCTDTNTDTDTDTDTDTPASQPPSRQSQTQTQTQTHTHAQTQTQTHLHVNCPQDNLQPLAGRPCKVLPPALTPRMTATVSVLNAAEEGILDSCCALCFLFGDFCRVK